MRLIKWTEKYGINESATLRRAAIQFFFNFLSGIFEVHCYLPKWIFFPISPRHLPTLSRWACRYRVLNFRPPKHHVGCLQISRSIRPFARPPTEGQNLILQLARCAAATYLHLRKLLLLHPFWQNASRKFHHQPRANNSLLHAPICALCLMHWRKMMGSVPIRSLSLFTQMRAST